MRTPAWLATIVVTLSAQHAALAQTSESPVRPEEVEADQGVFIAHVRRDGSVWFEDRAGRLQGAGFNFDVTDIVMRARGEEPYPSRKLAFLDGTREGRAAMARDVQLAQYQRSADLMRENIETVMRTVPDPQQRKQALFELWDECAETGEPELVAAGIDARAALVRYVRENLRGPDAFTPEELARFNASRTPVAAFAPYGPEAQAPELRVAIRSPRQSSGVR